VLRLKADAVEWREIEGEVVALDLRAARYLATNRSAAALWPLLVEGCEQEQLVERLVESYGIERSRALADVEAFVADLRQHDLLAAASQ
jgi:hypothetical protein